MLWLKFLTSRQIMAPEATKSNKTPAIIIIISFLRIFNMQSWFPCSPMSSIYMYLYRSCSIRNLKLHSCCLPLSALVFFLTIWLFIRTSWTKGHFYFQNLNCLCFQNLSDPRDFRLSLPMIRDFVIILDQSLPDLRGTNHSFIYYGYYFCPVHPLLLFFFSQYR